MKAKLPEVLPKAYLDKWGAPGTPTRLRRTASHIAFQRRLRERDDPDRYARAIECWQMDFDFLRSTFKNQLSNFEWDSLRRDS